jgi:bifunctional DNase/RNase
MVVVRLPMVIWLALSACGTAPPPATTPVVTAPSTEEPSPESREPAPRPTMPEGYVHMEARAVWPSPEGNALILVDDASEWVVPVIIGDAEAQIIDLRLRGERFERPLTHDLIDRLLEELHGEVVMVQINKLRTHIFIGSVFVWNGHRTIRIDARTSDAVAIAVGHRAPIYVDEGVVREAGISADQWEQAAPP